MDWSEGYLTEEYIYGYFVDPSPGTLRLACLSAGIAPPPTQGLRYLELGFGQGLSINIHAAAVPGEFWGNDFNPAQTAFARAMAEAAGSDAVLLEDSFAELANRPDLPEFDIIALHGIWTWISDENRRIIIDIIRRKLRYGGLVYVSYNSVPGWAPSAPLRHLIKLYGDLASSDTASVADRLDAGIKFTERVVEAGALYFSQTPAAVNRLKSMEGQDRHYLSHEYFTRDWRVMAFSDMVRVLHDAGLTFGASAAILDHFNWANITREGCKLLEGIEHPILRQSVRDFMVNEQFRRDVFVKGPRRLTRTERAEMLRTESFVLAHHPDDIPMQIKGASGDVTLKEKIYRPLIEVLAEENYAPKTLGQLSDHAKLKFLNWVDIFEAVSVLVGTYNARPALETGSEAQKRCAGLNRFLCERARDQGEIQILASPAAGSGVYVGRNEQLFILARQLGKTTIPEIAAYVRGLASEHGFAFSSDNRQLTTPEEILAALTKDVTNFLDKRMPMLKALGIA